MTQSQAPRFHEDQVQALVLAVYQLNVTAKALESYDDQNFLLKSDQGMSFILKISNATETRAALEAQNEVMYRIARGDTGVSAPMIVPTVTGALVATVRSPFSQTSHFMRLLRFVPGRFLAELDTFPAELLQEFGQVLANCHLECKGLAMPGAFRYMIWDLKNLMDLEPRLNCIADPRRRMHAAFFMQEFKQRVAPGLNRMPKGMVHTDPNDHNVLVTKEDPAHISGLIDFGDLVHTNLIFDPAIAAAYLILGKPNPLEIAAQIFKGYHQTRPFSEEEWSCLFPLIGARLTQSVIMSSHKISQNPKNTYLLIHQEPAWATLAELLKIHPDHATQYFKKVAGVPEADPTEAPEQLIQTRAKHLGPNLSTSYQEPLHINRGAMQYLFEADGRAFLDCVNNVCHVGHCNPRVVAAIQNQAAVLNTNTRYLHPLLTQYITRLSATFPKPLSVVYLVNSGSEANELALRLARAHTGGEDVLVLDGAYHGNTGALVDLSPYKFQGKGGYPKKPWVHPLQMPDTYRGPHKAHDPEAGPKYAADADRVLAQIKAQGGKPAALIAESLLSCGGQIVPPPDYLEALYQKVRAAGGVCIADEVQVGFGRVGRHFWGFEAQAVIPDIVTLGKPIGNGHPLGAVITTPEIAASFNTGMEYFNTFGGNPVSCAAGLAVLDVMEEAELQHHARDLGQRFQAGLRILADQHPIIGDIRGMGLFLGFELVRDQTTLEPADREATELVNRMKSRGVLLSTDGPHHNVIKIKPPMVFEEANVDLVLANLGECLKDL